MKHIVFFVSLFILFIHSLSAQNSLDYSSTRIIVQLQEQASATAFFRDAFEVNEKHSYRPMRSRVKTNIYFIDFVEEVSILSIVERFKNHPSVVFIEPDYVGTTAGNMMLEPNDVLYLARQYGLENNGDFPLGNSKVDADIDMEGAWDKTTGCENVVVAILDTGAKLNHPELSAKIWTNGDEELNEVDLDANGYIDDTRGWDFVNEDNDPSDDHGHGSNVSGIVSAKGNNNIGYAGVNWVSPSMQLKIINEDNFGFYSWWTEAIYYAVDNGANVINMSVGGSSFSSTMNSAVQYAKNNDVLITASMMNNDSDEKFYPAAFTNVIAVGATNPDDTRVSPFFWSNTSGSNFGSHIDLVAPGNYIYGLRYDSNTNFNSYWGGTSQAAPLVAGVASLMYCITGPYEGIVEDVTEVILNTAEDGVGDLSEDETGFDNYYGHGRLNANDALEMWSLNVSVTENSLYTMSIIPNPSKGVVNISWDLPDVNALKIFNIAGEMVKEIIVNDQSISIGELAAGVYLVRAEGIQGMITKKLIIQ